MLTGENGILNKAGQSKETTRGAQVQETVELEAVNNAGVDYIGGTKKYREQVISELHSQGLLTDTEVATLEESDIIIIGGITTDFSELPTESTPLATTYTITYNSNGGTGNMADTTGISPAVASNGFTAPTGKVFAGWKDTNGTSFTVGQTVSQNVTLNAQWEGGTIASGTYTEGQEIVYNSSDKKFELMTSSNSNNNEHFFVVADDGNSVRLLAKYCLLLDASAQTDYYATTNGMSGTTKYGRPFSGSNYWNGKSGVSYPCDLQTEERLEWIPSSDTVANNSIKAAKSYGNSKGVFGRLMTKAEADVMVSSNSAIMYGKWEDETKPVQSLNWWLGDAINGSRVWFVQGTSGTGTMGLTGVTTIIGVRPVVLVPEK